MDDTATVYFSIVNPTRDEISVTSINAYVISVCDSCDLPVRTLARYDLGNHAISMTQQPISDAKVVFPIASKQSEPFFFRLFPNTPLRRDYGQCLAGYTAILEAQFNDVASSEKRVVESEEIEISLNEPICKLLNKPS